MKIIKIIAQIALLYVFSFVGDWLHNLLHLPIPGSIIGLFLLFIALILKICPLTWIETGAEFLLAYLPLVFIPATVGVMNYPHLFTGSGVMLLFIVMVSTLIVMIAAGCTSQWLANRAQQRKEKKMCQEHLSQ